MEDTERLLKGAVEELDRLLSAKNVLAAPIEKEGLTVIPLVSYGFGFGAGGGADETKGRGGGTGGAGGIKPVGAIIIDKDGARVEGLESAMTGVIHSIGEAAAHVMEHAAERKADNKS